MTIIIIVITVVVVVAVAVVVAVVVIIRQKATGQEETRISIYKSSHKISNLPVALRPIFSSVCFPCKTSSPWA